MQKSASKFLSIILIIYFIIPSATAQVSHYRLRTADSLFAAQRYTQALSQFDGIIKNEEYSPSIFLKMAYIHEALGNIPKTQYFLSLYFLATKDDAALDKMSELAKKHHLEGYETTEMDKAVLLYKKNSDAITIVLLSFLLIALAFTIRVKLKKSCPLAPAIVVAVLSILLVTHVQLNTSRETFIIMQSNNYIMSGPSAAANVVEVAQAGHKLTVVGKKDVWLKIRWRNQDAYLKEGALLPVRL